MSNNRNSNVVNIQNRLDQKPLTYNDPAYHRSVFFRALDNAVKNKHLPKWKAGELRREYNQDLKESK